ncbi:MAG: alpha/beta hydrolase [Bacteroidota bacterium]
MKNSQLHQRHIPTNGLTYFIKEAGNKDAPLVLFLHGFPDSWYSWRHQLIATAEAGYYAVAPDMLGCGETDAPMEIERYCQDEMAKDLAELIEALGHEKAIVVGHDLGASLSWRICRVIPCCLAKLLMLN